ncbi:unnamed protein product, partial [Rotaria sp. Silwood2]
MHFQNSSSMYSEGYSANVYSPRTLYPRFHHQLLPHVKLIDSIKIPPRESCTVQAKLELSFADTVYFHPDLITQVEKSVLISPSLSNIKNYTEYFKIYNPNDYTRYFPMNTLLGQVTHAPHQVHSFPLFDPSRCFPSSASQHHLINVIELEYTPSTTLETIDKLLDHITNLQDKSELRLILQQHMQVFDISKATQAKTPIPHISNTGDSLSTNSRPYPRIIQQQREIQDEIQKMMQTNQIRPSNSPWSSP